MKLTGPFITCRSAYDARLNVYFRPGHVIALAPGGDDRTDVHLEGGETVCALAPVEDVLRMVLSTLGIEE